MILQSQISMFYGYQFGLRVVMACNKNMGSYTLVMTGNISLNDQ